ncbi:MAG: phosphopentomutase [Desulfobacterales bacterium]|nr:phosphopentomutase [Desulfobacterales bacterium]
MIDRVVLIVLDSAGVGAMPDAAQFNDAGANTLRNIFRARGSLTIPNLCSLGLGNIAALDCNHTDIIGCYGKMGESSPYKDTTTGHWEITGLVLDAAFPVYPQGFPPKVMAAFEKAIGTSTLGNYPCSGTEIIKTLGREHFDTGFPIVYTSADSVFQIAAHTDVVPLERLYAICQIARDLLQGEHGVGRVIARPFYGNANDFKRDNAARKDFSLTPPDQTLLDYVKQEGFLVCGIGKIGDLFGHRGLTEELHTHNNDDGVDQIIRAIQHHAAERGLIFANLVDFDMVYGHRRNVEGYAGALEDFDRRLPQILAAMGSNDVLMITADHGCDPTHQGHTDHTREYVPLLVYGQAIKADIDLGVRSTFADCGQTIADLLGLKNRLAHGVSFKGAIIDATAN